MVQVSTRRPARAFACCGGLADLLSPRLFKALSDPSRVALLVRLAESGAPRTVRSAAEGSNLDLSVVSRHLAILRDAGIIECQKHGKEVHCSVRTTALAQLLRDIANAIERCCPPSSGADGARTARRPARAATTRRTAP